MLKKCLKHEWKASWKGMAGINGAALALGLLGSLGILGTIHNMRIPDLVVVLYMFAYIVILVASSIVTYVLMAGRYYKSIFTDEGYLTNTLPVTSDQKILSRFLIFLFWGLVNILCIFGSLALLMAPLISEGLAETNMTMDIVMQAINRAFTEVALELGFSGLPMMSLFLTGIGLAGIVYSIMAIYFCISLGSLFSSHKILAAVLIYFGLNMVLQVITSGTTFIAGIISNDLAGSFPLVLLLNAFMELALAVVFYFINRYIMDKKLNLQ